MVQAEPEPSKMKVLSPLLNVKRVSASQAQTGRWFHSRGADVSYGVIELFLITYFRVGMYRRMLVFESLYRKNCAIPMSAPFCAMERGLYFYESCQLQDKQTNKQTTRPPEKVYCTIPAEGS